MQTTVAKTFPTPPIGGAQITPEQELQLQSEYLLMQMWLGKVRFADKINFFGGFQPLRPVIEHLEQFEFEGAPVIKLVSSETKKPKKFLGIQITEGKSSYWYEVTSGGHKFLASLNAWYLGVLKNFEVFGHCVWLPDESRWAFGLEALTDIYVKQGPEVYKQFLADDNPQGIAWEDWRASMIFIAFASELDDAQAGLLNLTRFFLYFAAREEVVAEGNRVVAKIGNVSETETGWVNVLTTYAFPRIAEAIDKQRAWEDLGDNPEDSWGYAVELLNAGRECSKNTGEALLQFLDQNRSAIGKYEAVVAEQLYDTSLETNAGNASNGAVTETVTTTTVVEEYVEDDPYFWWDPYYVPYYAIGIGLTCAFIW